MPAVIEDRTLAYTYKLSKRLALCYGVALSAMLALGACKADRLITPVAFQVSQVVVTPATTVVDPGQSVQFRAYGRTAAGDSITAYVRWSASSGTIASDGVYSAGPTPGNDRVVAMDLRTGVADTAAVTVTASAPGGGGGGGSVHTGYYASTAGTAAGDGSAARPWTLAVALAGANGRVQPGDTIWVRGGTYRGAWQSTVSGVAGSPVVVRQYPGERAILDGAGATTDNFVVDGPYTVIWGLEFTNSDPVRTTASTANDVRKNVIVNNASHTRFIDLVVHDGGVGFYTFASAVDVEVTGCIFYNNGWQGPDRGHGHGLYVKSNAGPVVLRDNIIFNQFGYGVHIYTNAGSGLLKNIQLDGNVSFNNGTLASNSSSANILIGGGSVASGIVARHNMTYFTPGAGAENVQLGYGSLLNLDIEFADNTVVGGSTVLTVNNWTIALLSGNVLQGSGRIVALSQNALSGWAWSQARYYRDPNAAAWEYGGVSYTFPAWQVATGLSVTDQAVAGSPTATQLVVRPNPYEVGRATIVVYNWARQAAVPVDLTGVLPAGAQYEIHNVQSLFSAPVVSGTYGGGAVSLPLSGVQPPAPIGLGMSSAPATGVDFNVYVLTVVP